MELEKFEQKQVAEISELQQTSNELFKAAEDLKVTDDESLKQANGLIKDINAHKKTTQEKRLALTQPLNNVIKQLIIKEKEVLHPLDSAKTHLSSEILDYQEEVERKRREEAERIEKICETMIDMFDMRVTQVETIDKTGANLKEYYEALPDEDKNNPVIKVAFMETVGKLSDHKNQIIEEERAEAERKRQAEEQKCLDEERAKQSEEEARIAAERKAIEDEKRAIEEEKARIEREKAELERQKEIAKAEKEAAKLQKSSKGSTIKTNAVEVTKFEIIDENAVDRIWCSPDEKKIREGIKNGMKSIQGVRIYTEKKVR